MLPESGSRELHRPHQPEPAHVAHDVVRRRELARALEQQLAERCRALDELRVVELAQRRETGGHREVVRSERRAVADGVLERVEDSRRRRARHQQRADRDVTAGERLRDSDEVRLEAPVLEREQPSRASEARLHLVDREERPVAAAELLRRHRGSRQAAGTRRGPGPARRGRARRPRCAARARARRGRRTAPVRSPAAAGRSGRRSADRRSRTSAPSVRPWKPCSHETTRVRPVAARPSLSAASTASVPGAREEHAGKPLRRPLQQLLGEQSRQQRHAELHRPGRRELEHLDERGAHARVVAPDVEHAEAAEHVEVAPVVLVVEVLTLGASPDAVEADRLQHAHELRVDPVRVELVILARARFEELTNHGGSVPLTEFIHGSAIPLGDASVGAGNRCRNHLPSCGGARGAGKRRQLRCLDQRRRAVRGIRLRGVQPRARRPERRPRHLRTRPPDVADATGEPRPARSRGERAQLRPGNQRRRALRRLRFLGIEPRPGRHEPPGGRVRQGQGNRSDRARRRRKRRECEPVDQRRRPLRRLHLIRVGPRLRGPRRHLGRVRPRPGKRDDRAR